ncbi:MAG: antibiotic acetyltransferase [Proteobacteria bacterium]|nr:antibiotic acetyltransferase [Pseudomonadota bacterium]
MGTGLFKTLRKYKLIKPLQDSPSIYTADDPEFKQFEIGHGTYGKPIVQCHWEGLATLKIGRYCSIASEVVIYLGGEHRLDWVTTYPFNIQCEEARGIKGHPWSRGDVVIEDDVWIGTGAFIRSGVRIGSGAVVGARSVVTRDVKPYEVVAGNPAQHIRMRFSETEISDLLKIAWWSWPHEKIIEEVPYLLSHDIQAFIRRNKKTS